MHPNKFKSQIGNEISVHSSDFNPIPLISLSPTHQTHLQHLQMQNQSTPHSINNYSPTQSSQNHLQIEIPSNPSPSTSSSSSIHQYPDQIIFQNEPISIPHKRPMSNSPSTLFHPPNFSSTHHYYRTPLLNSDCASSISVALRLFRHLSCIRWVRIRLRFCILLSVPALYVFTSNYHRRDFLLDFVFVVAFSAALLITLNLVIPRIPSIRLFLNSKINGSVPRPPVVWSIGSKRKPEKRKNSGSWVQVLRNGDVYEGEFHKGKCSGNGVYYYHMSGRYEGDWIDGKYDGYGVETWAKGSRYRGQYRQGLRHGVGVYRFFSGDVYAGEWSNGQCHGCGVYTCEDGGRYVGEFKWGVKHGLGHYHFRNSDIYAGEYFADKIQGYGAYQFGNGHRYEGAWHEGKRQGFGVYTYRHGDSQSGQWQNGVLSSSSTDEEMLIGSVDHSKVVYAVQEAQGAAERAHGTAAGMDERVKRAVASANRAANAARVSAVKAVQNQMHLQQL